MTGNSPPKKSILFVGHCYYNNWYLSNELKKLGWESMVLNMDATPSHSMYYHGEDFFYPTSNPKEWPSRFTFYLDSLSQYRIFHFSNTFGIRYFYFLHGHNTKSKWEHFIKETVYTLSKYIYNKIVKRKIDRLSFFRKILGDKLILSVLKFISPFLPYRWDVLVIKHFGGKISYTNNGCHDGVLQSSFSKWPTPTGEPVCNICPWKNIPSICSDKRMTFWGKFRNKMADYVGLTGGNRADYNLAPNVHENPYIYCLDKNFWHPDLAIPKDFLLPYKQSTIKIYHAVGNYDIRTHSGNKNIKSTHIYVDVIDRLKKEGFDIELIFFKDIPNKNVRYYQLQADIIVDMLSFGFYGATIREGMMLGKPCVCYLREEWMDQVRTEIPGYADENPVVSANELTIYDTLKELITNEQKRLEIGRKSRAFALKYHASDVAAVKMDEIYSGLLN